MTGSGGGGVQDLTLAYDAASNIVSIADNLDAARSQAFDYDDLNRVAWGEGAWGEVTYGFDGVGNRSVQALTVPAANDNFTYDTASNRLMSVARTGGGTRTFTYLPSGQMASDQRDPSTLYAYTYDAAGRLSTVSVNGAQIAAYGYDASERRVAKTLSSGTTHYIYDLSGRLIAEADGAAGATAIEYLWADDLPVALADSRTATAGLYFTTPII